MDFFSYLISLLHRVSYEDGDSMNMNFSVYQDIRMRTNGEIYLGVVGPVRTGKSTFIRRFMESLVLPFVVEGTQIAEMTDELPQAAQGKTIMTTEPKFVPAKAAELTLGEQAHCKVRLIDCVGFMVDGVEGHLENGVERMVHTPWFDSEVPFSKAARIGTEKVIHEHATVGIVMTTDGSFSEITRSAYEAAEEEIVQELKQIGKPFLIVLNSNHPFAEETVNLAKVLTKKYQVSVLPMNILQFGQKDGQELLEKLLYEFPIVRWHFEIPEWTRLLPEDHRVMQALLKTARKRMQSMRVMNQVLADDIPLEGELVSEIRKNMVNPATGEVDVRLCVPQSCYYEYISELTGETIANEGELVHLLVELSEGKQQVNSLAEAFEHVHRKGYGVVKPQLSEIMLSEPQLMKHGNKFGIRIKAYSPSIHLIKANIETEIAPIVGSREQAEGLLSYMREEGKDKQAFLNINIFGKTVGELVEDGIGQKIAMMDEDSQQKLMESMEKIVNDLNGGMVCIII
ncbi:stage IV sporulation protein A [Lachnospiraceae bacterium XBB1006]|nr:stage IV sporulation protein A [Lachnospiraceae bacterium XBB1006]